LFIVEFAPIPKTLIYYILYFKPTIMVGVQGISKN